MDTEILTRSGWKTWDQIADGDETPGFNPETGCTEWTRITAVTSFPATDIIEARSYAWSVRSTGGHRWVAQDSKTGQYYWSTTDGRRDGEYPKRLGRHRDTWVIAAPLQAAADLPLSLDEAELLGWLVADGGQHDGHHHRGVNFSIHAWQTKPAGVARLGEILGDRASWNGKGYRLRNAYARDLLQRAGLTHIKDGAQLLTLVASMSTEQREAMLAGVIGGDGNGNGQVMQNEGPLLDVITTLAYFCGYRTTVTKHKCSPSCWGHKGTPMVVNLGRPKVSTYRQGRRVVAHAPVWCPTTELGSWTAKFEHNVVLTGNSHVHWAFDQGGYLPPGLSTVYNGTGRPEPVLTGAQWDAVERGGSGQRIGNLTVNAYYPEPEPVSTTTSRIMRRAAAFGPA